jgi:hypothetical protein
MKIQLNTVEKTIAIEDDVVLGEFVDFLKTILPNSIWKEYRLEVKVINNYVNPIVIPYQPYNPYPNPYVPSLPWITMYDSNTVIDTQTNAGIFNIDMHHHII